MLYLALYVVRVLGAGGRRVRLPAGQNWTQQGLYGAGSRLPALLLIVTK